MTKENAINFVLYSLLGVTLGDSKDQLLEAAINRAYRDASSHVLSVREEKEEKDSVRESATRIIKDAIENQLNGNEYDYWYNQLCYELLNHYKGKTTKKKPFTYGIAQKWVNMTMKYLFVLRAIYNDCKASWPSELGFLDKYEKDLHVPIDGYIIEAAWNEESVYLPLKDGAERGKAYKYPHEHVEAWSTWDVSSADESGNEPCAYYKRFQKSVKKVIEEDKCESPLDWENKNWIRIAEHRKQLEKEAKSKTGKNRKN